ncbi:hypothetical protein EVAR_56931_1 [Eumeta japonica]|uniref:Uncharacterized protein n=1 Tax=Eumeta variegata TaxID=151549 RepID=A0A4C1YDM7_EUMVA|nr:hypothetical protein EVAR_56931_1 [Eumeta japonica]
MQCFVLNGVSSRCGRCRAAPARDQVRNLAVVAHAHPHCVFNIFKCAQKRIYQKMGRPRQTLVCSNAAPPPMQLAQTTQYFVHERALFRLL